MAIVDGDRLDTQDAIVVEFLRGDALQRWVESTLGL
jgi:hypothetical protein